MRCYVQLKDSGWIWRVTWEKNQKRDFIQIYFWPQSLGSFLNRKLLTPVERHLFFFLLSQHCLRRSSKEKKKKISWPDFFFSFFFLQMAQKLEKKTFLPRMEWTRTDSWVRRIKMGFLPMLQTERQKWYRMSRQSFESHLIANILETFSEYRAYSLLMSALQHQIVSNTLKPDADV